MLLLSVSAIFAQTNFRPISYAEGVKAAKAEGKLVFIDFFTTWCGPCAMMANETFPQKKMGEYFNERFVCLKIDAEKGEGVELAKRFNVTGYPTFVVLDVEENVLGRRVGATTDTQEFIAAIERICNPAKSPSRLRERYAKGERSAELIEAYSNYLIDDAHQGQETDQKQIDEAYRMVEEYFGNLTDSQKVAPENAFVYLQYAASPMDKYGRYMIAHRDEFAPAEKKEIAGRIKSLYETYLIATLAGHQPYHKENYETVKKEVVEQSLNADGRYTPVFHLIEGYATGDMDTFLDLCEREYRHLTESDKMSLILGMNDLIKTNDEKIVKRAGKFIRQQLPDMSVANIYFAAGVIDQLESRTSHLRAIVPAVPAR